MDPLILILVLVLTASAAQVSACNLSKTNETHQCYGAVGESLSLLLAADSSKKEIILKKGNTRILKFIGTNQDTKIHKDYLNRSEFCNGTFLLNGAMRNDSGLYKIEIYYPGGILQRHVNMLLVLQAPVSEPVLSYFCLPNGEYLFTCISNGDDLQFKWTLNNQTLTKNVTYNVVKLKNNYIRNLSCIVQNKVSSLNSTIDLPTCQEMQKKKNHQHLRVVLVTLAVFLSAVTLTVLFALFNQLYKKQASGTDTSESGNIVDVVYSDVKIHKQTKKQPSVLSATMEYGQIKKTRCSRQPPDTFYHM